MRLVHRAIHQCVWLFHLVAAERHPHPPKNGQCVVVSLHKQLLNHVFNHHNISLIMARNCNLQCSVPFYVHTVYVYVRWLSDKHGKQYLKMSWWKFLGLIHLLNWTKQWILFFGGSGFLLGKTKNFSRHACVYILGQVSCQCHKYYVCTVYDQFRFSSLLPTINIVFLRSEKRLICMHIYTCTQRVWERKQQNKRNWAYEPSEDRFITWYLKSWWIVWLIFLEYMCVRTISVLFIYQYTSGSTYLINRKYGLYFWHSYYRHPSHSISNDLIYWLLYLIYK